MKNSIFKRIGNFIVANLKDLIVSLVLAIVIWFAVSIQVFPNVYDHIYDIPVNIEPTPFMLEENLQIVDCDDTVNIQIMGKRYVIGTLSNADFVATADLSSVTAPGKYTVDIQVKPLSSSTEYEVVTKGLQASITVERIITKTFDVVPDIDSLQIGEGLTVNEDEVICSPTTVTITAEESVVKSIGEITVTPVTSSALEVTTELKGTLSIFKKDGTKIDNPDLELSDDSYTLTVPVWKVKTLPLNISLTVPSGFDEESLSYSILPTAITIAAPASDSSIDNLDRIDIGDVQLSDLSSKDLQGIKLTIALPTGYRNLSNVAIAQVNFGEAENYGKLDFTVPSENFTILNGDPEYEFSFVTSQLDVSVVGPSEVLRNLTPDDISGTVNLLGVTAADGVKSVTISMKIEGENVTAWVTGDYKVEIMAQEIPEQAQEEE